MGLTLPPRRLIESALPFRQLDEAARRERGIRHGHPSTLHLWWARRPLTSSRGVILSALFPDPADPACPPRFRDEATARMRVLEARGKAAPRAWESPAGLRDGLVSFIADFARWESSEDPDYLETSRALVEAAHAAETGVPGRPLLVDPFAGGGSIPVEALRVGADAFASDLNPVAVLIEKVLLEYVPRYGLRLAEELRRAGAGLRDKAMAMLGGLYPPSPAGVPAVAYLWAREVRCDGCGALVPLLRSGKLARGRGRNVGVVLFPHATDRRIEVQIVEGAQAKSTGEGSVRHGSVFCPICGLVTSIESLRAQMRAANGGAASARMIGVIEIDPGSGRRRYRSPAPSDLAATRQAKDVLEERERTWVGRRSFVPDEPIGIDLDLEDRVLPIVRYGIVRFRDAFTPRQLLVLATLAGLVVDASSATALDDGAPALEAVLALAVDQVADGSSSLSEWSPRSERIAPTFSRPALPMRWSFAEGNPWSSHSGSFSQAIERIAKVIEALAGTRASQGRAESAAAAYHPLPDGQADLIVTDPPHYDNVAYADLSGFFYVWLKRALRSSSSLFLAPAAPKAQEVIVNAVARPGGLQRDAAFYERELERALSESRRVLRPDGIGVLVFASRSMATWVALVRAVMHAGWSITAAWPAAPETPGEDKLLGAPFYLVAWPRAAFGAAHPVGDWTEVRRTLREHVRERLLWIHGQDVIGAEAFVICLGAALYLFSRYEHVEDSAGHRVPLEAYLETMWEVTVGEALAMMFERQSERYEGDALQTVIWLWTLFGTERRTREPDAARVTFDIDLGSARILAQAVGSSLEEQSTLIHVGVEAAALLSVPERIEALGWKTPSEAVVPTTTLGRLHVAMHLSATGEDAALRQLLIDDGAGRDDRFWRLASVLAALYPTGSSERRWVESVLGRKKELGL